MVTRDTTVKELGGRVIGTIWRDKRTGVRWILHIWHDSLPIPYRRQDFRLWRVL